MRNLVVSYRWASPGISGIFMLLLVALSVFFILNIMLGSVYIPATEVFSILFTHDTVNLLHQTIIINTRLPQAVTAVLAGSALGAAGLMMQTLFRNPLAGPSVLGVSSGASLGVAVMMLFINFPGGTFQVFKQVTGNISVIVAAFVGAFAVLFIIGLIAGRFKSSATLLIIGMMISYALTSITGVLQFYSLKEDLQAFVIWGLGSFANVGWDQIPFLAVFVAIGLLLFVAMTKPLNTLLLGENYALNLGTNIRTAKVLIIIATGLLTAAVTAFCGPIAFLGLAVPHLSRNLFKTSNHLTNVPGVIITGALLALICNLIARLPGFDGALPINAVTSLVGAPVVIWIILRQSKFRADA